MSQRSLRRAQRLLPKIMGQIDELIAISTDPERMQHSKADVSKWSIGQHVEHLALAHSGVIARFESLIDGSVTDRGGPTIMGHVILALGRFPRGRGKAPETTKPKQVDQAKITQRLTGMRSRLARHERDLARMAASDATFKHPIFGPLNAVQWLGFLDIHHRHHARIVSDIERR